MKTRNLTYIGIMVALIAVCAWITIPTVVPFTLQTFGVFLAVALLGGKRGTLAVLVYLLLGAVGAPVFAGFTGGPGKLLGMTGGYILGFLVQAAVMWLGERLMGRNTASFLLFGVLGLAACYLFGSLWYLYLYTTSNGPIGILAVLGQCVLSFLPMDLVKLVLALLIGKRLARPLGYAWN